MLNSFFVDFLLVTYQSFPTKEWRIVVKAWGIALTKYGLLSSTSHVQRDFHFLYANDALVLFELITPCTMA